MNVGNFFLGICSILAWESSVAKGPGGGRPDFQEPLLLDVPARNAEERYEVPNLIGLDYGKAMDSPKGLHGFKVRVPGFRRDASPVGTMLQQDPLPGIFVENKGAIYVIISSGLKRSTK